MRSRIFVCIIAWMAMIASAWCEPLDEPDETHVAETREPILSVEPSGFDFGAVDSDATLTGKIRIRNKGSKMLHWKAVIPANTGNAGRYIPFQSSESRGKGVYSVPPGLQKTMELSGSWAESEGFPSSTGTGNTLACGFTGSGIEIIYWKDNNAGKLSVYLDNEKAGEIDGSAPARERAGFMAARGIAEAPHTLKLVGNAGPLGIEGIRIYGSDILQGPPGWIKVFPDIGNTASQTNYVTMNIYPAKLKTGWYIGRVDIESDGGRAAIEVSLCVTGSKGPKIFAVYKYVRGADFLFTGSPESEDQNYLRYYRKQGIAFRLFREDTPGTRKLYRWYNPHIGDHFYSQDRSGHERPLHGYSFEGPIGNIATSRLPGTRELYRWYNRSSGQHYYTTDSKGGGLDKQGYRYDGIVGFVR